MTSGNPLPPSVRLWRALADPLVARLAIALGVLLAARSLAGGLMSDDYIIAAAQKDHGRFALLSKGPLDLFNFVPRTADGIRGFMEEGVFPWWTDPAVRASRLHPLSSASHALDHLLWPSTPWLWHAHSLVWFLFALLAVAAVYRRLFGPGSLSTMAVLLFALDDAHGGAVGWVAARNSLMALAFSALSMAAHIGWRKAGWRAGALIGPLALALGLMSSEMAIGAMGYVLAYAVILDEGTLQARLSRMSGYLLVVAAWVGVYVGLRFGTSHTGLYIDPVHEPVAFLLELGQRLPVLLAAQILFPWSDLWLGYGVVHPALPWIMWGIALVVVGLAFVAVAPIVRRHKLARFAAVGMVLSAIPVSAGIPFDRVLLLVGIGAMALAAMLVDDYVERRTAALSSRACSRLSGLATALIVVFHLAANLWLLPLRCSAGPFQAMFVTANESVPLTPSVKEKTVVLLNPPIESLALYMAFMRDLLDQPRPGRVRVLGMGTSAMTVSREDERTLRVRPDKGFLANPADTFLRGKAAPFAAGDVVSLPDVAITVVQITADLRPAEVVFRFAESLSDPSFVFLRWGTAGGYVPFDLPDVGKSLRVDAVRFRELFARREK